MGLFRELPDSSHKDRNADFGELLNLFCPLQWLLGCRVFTIIRKLLVFKATSELGHGNKASKNLTKLTVLIEIQLFLLNKCTSDFYKPLVNFQSYEKVDFNNFTSVMNACMEWWLFRGPYSTSPTDVTLKSLHFLMPGLELKEDNFQQKVLGKKQAPAEHNRERRKKDRI